MSGLHGCLAGLRDQVQVESCARYRWGGECVWGGAALISLSPRSSVYFGALVGGAMRRFDFQMKLFHAAKHHDGLSYSYTKSAFNPAFTRFTLHPCRVNLVTQLIGPQPLPDASGPTASQKRSGSFPEPVLIPAQRR